MRTQKNGRDSHRIRLLENYNLYFKQFIYDLNITQSFLS